VWVTRFAGRRARSAPRHECAVKTGSDATPYQVSRATWHTGVNYLDSLTPPSSFGSYAQNHRIKWPEFHTWQINDTTLVAINIKGLGFFDEERNVTGAAPNKDRTAPSDLHQGALTGRQPSAVSRPAHRPLQAGGARPSVRPRHLGQSR